ncbi:hypothetical protein PWT90_11080 [Aphanocladium album]|nr:hypothetical protein PWT90_11080 [Aphanocladium album]
MTLTFTTKHPSVILERRLEVRSFVGGLPPLSPNSHNLPVPYFGHVELEDGGSRVFFAVEPTPAYQACKESRAFLHFFFEEDTNAKGGLPSWYRSEIDIIKFEIRCIHDVIKHAWFLRTQHLMLTMWDEDFYLGNLYEVVGHDWIEENLLLLRDVTVHINEARTYSEVNLAKDGHWLTSWFSAFESFYHPEEAQQRPPLRFHVRVISDAVPEEEWLTPTNYLRVEKLVHQRMLHFDPQHEKRDRGGWKAALMRATDNELDNPAEYVGKRRLAQRLIWELDSRAYRLANPPVYGPENIEEW